MMDLLYRRVHKGGRGRYVLPLLLSVCTLLLTACGILTDNIIPEPEEGVLIYAALNPVTETLEKSIAKFNENHEDVQIEIHDYSDEDGPQRLMVELAAGYVPDIMELRRIGYEWWSPTQQNEEVFVYMSTPMDADMSGCYWMPYRQLAERGYLEDLWPYIENDPSFGREGVLEAPLKAAEVNGGLYMLFKDVGLNTLVGMKRVVGDTCGWTIEEFLGAFSNMPPGSTVFRYDTVQSKVFFALLAPMLNQYIDWETGQCSFDSEAFYGLVEFLKCFPAEFETTLTEKQIEEEAFWRESDGMQMLQPIVMRDLWIKTHYDTYFKYDTAYTGYPTADGSYGGSFVIYGNVLGMSSTCKNKEVAWEYMRQLIRWSTYRTETAMWNAHQFTKMHISVNKKDYNMGNLACFLDKGGLRVAFSGGPELETFPPTEEDLQVFEYLVNNTTQIYWPDSALSDVVWDAIGPYLAGDRSLEDTIDQVQRRVKLYVNEQM